MSESKHFTKGIYNMEKRIFCEFEAFVKTFGAVFAATLHHHNYLLNFGLNAIHFLVYSFTCRFIIKMIRTDHALLQWPHWKMCKQFDVPNSIRMAASIRWARIPKHSGYVNIHRSLKSGKQFVQFICGVHMRNSNVCKRTWAFKVEERETTAQQ